MVASWWRRVRACGTTADGSVDNSVVAEQWSSYVALPEIIPVCPEIMQPQTVTVNTPSGQRSALKLAALGRRLRPDGSSNEATLDPLQRRNQVGEADFRPKPLFFPPFPLLMPRQRGKEKIPECVCPPLTYQFEPVGGWRLRSLIPPQPAALVQTSLLPFVA